jgi:hypothetical protein
MITLDAMAEQIQRNYLASVESENIDPTIDRREIYPLIVQLLNSKLSSVEMKEKTYGNILIPTCIMATYRDMPVLDDDGRKYVDLPAYPIRLPRDMGVWDIQPSGSGWKVSYIPTAPAMMKILGDLEESALEGQEGYWIESNRAYFRNTTVPAAVDIQLLVADYTTMSPSDYLPVYSNLEAEILVDAVQILKGGGLRLPWQKVKDLPESITPEQVEKPKEELN